MAYIFLGVSAPSPTLQQDVLIALALAVLALFLPMLLVVRAAREATQKGHLLEQECVSSKLSLPLPAGVGEKTVRRKKRKARKHCKTTSGRHGGQDGSADGGQMGLSDSDDAGAALEAAWSGSEAADATLKNHLYAGSCGAAGVESMAALVLSASASQAKLQQAETNELPGVVEHQQSDEFHAEVRDCWQPSLFRNSIRQQRATADIEQKNQTSVVLSCPPGLLPLHEAEPHCKPEQTANGAEWGCIAERRYSHMLLLLHREIRAETLQRCPPGLGPPPGSTATTAQESMPLRGLSTRRLTFRP